MSERRVSKYHTLGGLALSVVPHLAVSDMRKFRIRALLELVLPFKD
jgi:hypothetical protein